MTPSTQPTLLLIGDDALFTYLIGRYAMRRGFQLQVSPTLPPASMLSDLQPAAIFFLALESLEASQPLAELETADIPLLVCSAPADEVRARELGADYCLQHPLTYESFVAALQATIPNYQ